MKMGARPRAQTNSAASGAQERTSRGYGKAEQKTPRVLFARAHGHPGPQYPAL